MTDYRFTKVLVWDNLGGNVRPARNQRVDVTDPDTGAVAADLKVSGQPVSFLTSDSSGHVDFTSTQGIVRLTSQSGFWQDFESPDLRVNAVQAGVDAQNAADSAAASAASAQSAANLVGAPAGAAVDAAAGSTVVRYASPTGNDSASGKTWGSAKATIAAAVAALGGPGVVYLSPGTFIQSQGRVVVPSGVTIRGAGPSTVVQLKANSLSSPAPDLFYVNGVTGVAFHDFTLDGNWPNQPTNPTDTYRGILIQDAYDVTVRNCTFQNMQHQGIQVAGAVAGDATTHGVTNISVMGCTFRKTHNSLHITESQSQDVHFANNTVENTTGHGFTTYPGANRVQVIGNSFRDVATDMAGNGSGIRIFETTNAVVEGNYVENPNLWAIRMTTNNPTITNQMATRVVIANNVLRGGARAGSRGGGIMVDYSDKVTISGNIIEDFTAALDGNSIPGIQVRGNYATVANNIIRNVQYAGVFILGNGATVTGNHISYVGNRGIRIGGGTVSARSTITGNIIVGNAASLVAGIDVQSDASAVEVSGNSFTNCTTNVNNQAATPVRVDGRFVVSGVPTAGTYRQGDKFTMRSPFNADITSWVCVGSGTMGTLSGVTATTTAGSADVTVNTVGTLAVDQYVTIAGVTGTKRVVAINGTTVTLDSTASASVSGAAVAYSAAVLNAEAASSKYGSITWDPASIASGAGVTSPVVSVGGATFGSYIIVSPPYDLQGLSCTGYVSTAGSVVIRLDNQTGAAIDLASGTWKVKAILG